MIITELIREQVFQCAVMAGAGVFVMVAYQLFKCVGSLLDLPLPAQTAAEILFWIAAAAAVSHFMYYCAYGRLSFHALAAFTAGALLWKKLFYDIINKLYIKLHIRQGIYNKYGEKEKEQPVQGHQSGDRH